MKTLEINQIGPDGSIARRVPALAGRITVLRSRTAGELDPYRTAIQGGATNLRFSMLLDGAEFKPADHNFVGFSETFTGNEDTAQGFLAKAGFEEGKVEAELLARGLGGISKKKLSELAEGEARGVRLLAATRNSDKALILDDPFKGIPEKWIESFAELLLQYVREKNGLVFVVSLSHRPECWLENELLSRIQIGEVRKKTIGFGSDSDEATQIQDLRKQLDKERLTTAKAEEVKKTSWKVTLVVFLIYVGIIAWVGLKVYYAFAPAKK